ncbi:Uncharacterized protein {ECO:0000313/EMBL:CCF09109.1} [Pantoea ananatis]|nr:Uncharacterized protein {ECO:0000313/EMBL:CCF09109.1} [Pantoea ananatis]
MRNRFPFTSLPGKIMRFRTLQHFVRRRWSRFSCINQQAMLECVNSHLTLQ